LEMELDELKKAATEVRLHGYTPYSGFKVGAAIIDQQGRIHAGCNVENAAYGPTNCAERTALFRAIADGIRPGQFQAMAVIADTDGPIAPCGVCRQVIAELCGPDMPIWLGNLRGVWIQTTISDLLPGAFRASDLGNNN